MANASETALHTSMSGCSGGRVPSLRKRRSSDSEAQRYWVGFSPILENARRQPGAGGGEELGGARAGRDVAGDSLDVQGPRHQLGEVTPDLAGMLKMH